ncbi:MAG: DUF3500 domain-containing protein [Ignavibacteriales bacterium]|nr:DUF3500 domain-containing protein [Ignavibacteriales bacterium]
MIPSFPVLDRLRKNRVKGLYFSGVVAIVVIAFGVGDEEKNDLLSRETVNAATRFLNELHPHLKLKAIIPFESEERFNWHFVPRSRKGVSLKELNDRQRDAAHSLLKSALSEKGYSKATGVIVLESVLREIEGQFRDPDLYYLTIFGTPSESQPWGWRLEGHHLSANYSSVTKGLVATTPTFFGSNPAHVREGPHKGLRVLRLEEDLARELVLTLDNAQRAKTIISSRAPSDIITGSDREADIGKQRGLAASDMSHDQRAMLMRLVEEYINNFRSEIADEYLSNIGKDGIEKIHFAWAGRTTTGEPHYYRIHGPNFVLEYDNTQDDANHIHAVWRDFKNDFGIDYLTRHYESSPHHKNP